MPLYEYRCTKCAKLLEVIQGFKDAPLKTCESCGGRLQKLISRSGFVLKGSGWYQSDYSAKTTGSTSDGPAAEAPATGTPPDKPGAGAGDAGSTGDRPAAAGKKAPEADKAGARSTADSAGSKGKRRASAD